MTYGTDHVFSDAKGNNRAFAGKSFGVVGHRVEGFFEPAIAQNESLMS
jgi:hypothetical protein